MLLLKSTKVSLNIGVFKLMLVLFHLPVFTSSLFMAEASASTSLLQILFIAADPAGQALGGGNPVISSSQDLLINPSLMIRRTRPEVNAGYTSWFEGITIENVSLSVPVMGSFAAGVSALQTDYGEIDGYSIMDIPSGSVGAGDSVISVGAAYEMRNVAAGIGYSMIEQFLSASDKGKVTAFTAGIDMRLRSFDLGASYFLPMGSISYGDLSANQDVPSIMRTGLGVKLAGVRLAAAVITPSEGEAYQSAGAEIQFKDMIRFRLGMNTITSVIGMNAGIGVSLENIKFDYAFAQTAFGNQIHSFSFGFKFGPANISGRLLGEAKSLFKDGFYERSSHKLDDVLILDPDNSEANDLKARIAAILSTGQTPSSKEEQ